MKQKFVIDDEGDLASTSIYCLCPHFGGKQICGIHCATFRVEKIGETITATQACCGLKTELVSCPDWVFE